MDFFNKLLQFLNKPFPKTVTWFGLSKNFMTISVVMTLFLYIFQPSGISEVGPNKFLVCLGFGVSGALAYFIYELIFNQLFKFTKTPTEWTFGKWLLYSIGVLFTVSLANFLYIRYVFLLDQMLAAVKEVNDASRTIDISQYETTTQKVTAKLSQK